jgi:hypothetical protein
VIVLKNFKLADLGQNFARTWVPLHVTIVEVTSGYLLILTDFVIFTVTVVQSTGGLKAITGEFH